MKRFSMMIAFVTMTMAGGCWTTTVKSGRPVGPVAPGADDSWHSGLVTGGVELSGPYDLESLCPQGWAEIRTQTTFANELVEILTFHLYAPQTVRVKCAAEEREEG